MKIAHPETPAREDPKRMSTVQLARLGVEVVDRDDLLLRCVTCGETWSPPVDRNGKLWPGYWYCPNSCNI